MGALIGHHGLLMPGSGGGGYQTETTAWENGIIAAGGSVLTSDKNIVDAQIIQMKTRSYYSKIKAWWPMVGPTILCHQMPAIDTVLRGISTNSGFTDADVDTTTGMVNTGGAAKILNSLYRPSNLPTSGNGGGIGIFMKAWTNGATVEPMGCYTPSNSNARYVIDVRSGSENFRWGSTLAAATASAASAGFYYGQMASSTSRKLFKNGSLLNHQTTSDVGSVNSSSEIRIGGCIDHTGALTYGNGTWVGAIITDGTLTDTEAGNLYTDLAAFNTACGR